MSFTEIKDFPDLNNPALLAAWPGMGNVGYYTISAIQLSTHAELIGRIEPEDYYFPLSIPTEGFILQEIEYPSIKFYHYHGKERDFILCLGDAIPDDPLGAHSLCYEILDLAKTLGINEIYTAGAVSMPIHHSQGIFVYAVASNEAFAQEILHNNNFLPGLPRPNSLLVLTGMNGLLAGLGKKAKLNTACLISGMPDYLTPVPYPALYSIMELYKAIGAMFNIDTTEFPHNHMMKEYAEVLSNLMSSLPEDLKNGIDKRLQKASEVISPDDAEWMKRNISSILRPDSNHS
ncbi:MAG: PAC2 family protein [Eubacteriales bacterium]|jgi:hypothetical protein